MGLFERVITRDYEENQGRLVTSVPILLIIGFNKEQTIISSVGCSTSEQKQTYVATSNSTDSYLKSD
jgi:hypothetical protein